MLVSQSKASTEAGYGSKRREEKKIVKYGDEFYLGSMTPPSFQWLWNTSTFVDGAGAARQKPV